MSASLTVEDASQFNVTRNCAARVEFACFSKRNKTCYSAIAVVLSVIMVPQHQQYMVRVLEMQIMEPYLRPTEPALQMVLMNAKDWEELPWCVVLGFSPDATNLLGKPGVQARIRHHEILGINHHNQLFQISSQRRFLVMVLFSLNMSWTT